MNRACGLIMCLALGACAIPENDTLAGFGQRCRVSEGLCSLDLVCRPDEPGADEGLCEPVADYGACKKPEHLPGRVGTVEDGPVTIDEGADVTKIEGVRLVNGNVLVHDRVRELELGDTCAFRALQRVEDGFYLGNTDITSIDGLGSLTSVKNGVALFGNRELESLDGLAHLVEIEPCTVDTNSVQIVIANNDSLPASAIDSFAEQLEIRLGKRPQMIRCGNGPSNDEDPTCSADAAAVVLALQDGGELCE